VNKPIRRVTIALVILFLGLLCNVEYIQVLQAGSLSKRPDNRRVLLDEYSRERGPILVGGTPIAESVPTKDSLKYLRKYPDGPLYAQITGFYSSIYGRSDLEQTQNQILAGTDNRLFVRRVIDLVSGQEPSGGSVLLTINPKAQKAAAEAMGNMKGAVVAIEPKTGKILAMVSHPTYDPNALASHDVATQQKAWKKLTRDKQQPMLNRATQSRFPPGSTFKLVTAAAALSTGKFKPSTKLPSPRVLDVPQTSKDIHNENGSTCGAVNGRLTMSAALAVSCNTTFAGLGLRIGQDVLRTQAQKFGFGSYDLDDLPGASSVFPPNLNPPQLAQSSIGQFDVAATPLQMAMVSAAIANGGQVMKPYLSAVVRGPDLRPLSITKPQVLSQAVTPEVARQLTKMMVGVVAHGTGTTAQMSGLEVAGKTGTAQSAPTRKPYAWFTSFAPAKDAQVAVAVVIEDADIPRSDIAGGRLAAPVAKAVMEAVIGQ